MHPKEGGDPATSPLPPPLSWDERTHMREIASRHAPTVLFDGCERLFPSSVEEFVAHSRIVDKVHLTPPRTEVARALGSRAPHHWSLPPPVYVLIWPGTWDTYERVYTLPTDWFTRGEFVISYFIFFPLSQKGSSLCFWRGGCPMGATWVGDVHQMLIHFRGFDPIHCTSGGRLLGWGDVARARSTKTSKHTHSPLLTSKRGSHTLRVRKSRRRFKWVRGVRFARRRIKWLTRKNCVLIDQTQWGSLTPGRDTWWLTSLTSMGDSEGFLQHPPFSYVLAMSSPPIRRGREKPRPPQSKRSLICEGTPQGVPSAEGKGPCPPSRHPPPPPPSSQGP